MSKYTPEQILTEAKRPLLQRIVQLKLRLGRTEDVVEMLKCELERVQYLVAEPDFGLITDVLKQAEKRKGSTMLPDQPAA